jgi:hypothetical protein
MKAILFVALLAGAVFTPASFAQDDDKFERSYHTVRMMCSMDLPELGLVADEWSETVAADNRFVFNYGEDNDVVCFDASGNQTIYQQVTEITEGTNDTGDEYQEMGVTSAEGDDVTIMLFEDFLSLIHYYEDGSYLIIQYYFD